MKCGVFGCKNDANFRVCMKHIDGIIFRSDKGDYFEAIIPRKRKIITKKEQLEWQRNNK